MRTIGRTNRHAADLHWLAFLLTGNRERSIDAAAETIAASGGANPFFESWMLAWSRRVVIAKALTAIRKELAASARRTELARLKKPALPPRDWTFHRDATKSEIENALLAIDDFPRAALILSVFEGVSFEDSTILLDARPGLVRKALAMGLRELTSNLARVYGWTPVAASRRLIPNEVQYG